METPQKDRSAWIKPVTLVLAEDHVAVRELLVRHLSTSVHYRVIAEIKDGSAVAMECERLKPHVLVLDLGLPGLDGLEAAKEVQRRSPHTRILVFSGFNDPGTVQEAMRAGVSGFVDKSAGIDVFDRALAAVSLGQTYFERDPGETVTAISSESVSKGLSARQREVLRLVAEGLTTKQISEKLGISMRTAEHHRQRAMSRVGAHNAADLTREAYRLGLLQATRRTLAER